MYNDFVIVGPGIGPGQVKGNDIAAALQQAVRPAATPFISRADKSGTHAAELRLWKIAGVDMAAAKPAGYKECGCGMGPALNMALVDRRLRADRSRHLAVVQEPG